MRKEDFSMDWDKQIYEWKEILDKIDREVDFFQKIKDGVSREDMKEFLRPYNLFLTGGMCRIVLISNHLDTVIKISDDESNGVDYNAMEISNYEKALRNKVDKYFCKCKSLGTRDKFSIEIMEKVKPMNEDEISEELYGDDEPPEDFGCEDWVLDEIFEYTSELMKFLDSEGINDIHLGNIGYNNSGRIVILDYAGY